MIEYTETFFGGLNCVELSNELISICLTRDVGPRIIGLAYKGGDNLLAVLPDHKIIVEGAEDYSLRGGHRLWYAPEKPDTTYIADDQLLDISPIENGLQLVQNVDAKTGIQKSLQVVLDEDNASLKILHKLTNLGQESFELAPWAITQLQTGGTAILPLQTDNTDKHGLLPNRQLILWPYTNINSPHLNLNDKAIAVNAGLGDGALKIGAPNPIGWLAYVWGDTLFVKRASHQKGEHYLDRGASSQIYCNSDFIELETLGPVVNLGAGEHVEHQEIWEIYSGDNWPKDVKEYYGDLGGT